MEITSKLIKPVSETKYLTAENCWRYRSILRFFYLQYEKIKYWMYKEQVFEELKRHSQFAAYTMDQCMQDLGVLVEWGNLIPVQDTSRAASVEEFKNKQFRYQLSEYSVEIERLTIKLESLFIEGASLEPTLFERIKDHLRKFPSIASLADIRTAGTWWRDLNNDFKRLNQNYQDYMRSFYSIKAEEMMKSSQFISYKDGIIDYLREFVRGLQRNGYEIEVAIKSISDETINNVLKKVFESEKAVPRLEMEVSDKDLYENILGRWDSITEWFIGKANHGVEASSEASKLLDITNEVIRKITRYASQIAESRSSASNRKEEYKKLCSMFLSCTDVEEAHKLSALAFGITSMRHVKTDLDRKTESVSSSVYEESPHVVELRPRVRAYKERNGKSIIEDKTKRKQELKEKFIKNLEQERCIMDSYMNGNSIDIMSLPLIESHVRITLLKWIAKGTASVNRVGKTEDGRVFKLSQRKDVDRCVLKSVDGDIEMPAYIIDFEKDGVGA